MVLGVVYNKYQRIDGESIDLHQPQEGKLQGQKTHHQARQQEPAQQIPRRPQSRTSHQRQEGKERSQEAGDQAAEETEQKAEARGQDGRRGIGLMMVCLLLKYVLGDMQVGRGRDDEAERMNDYLARRWGEEKGLDFSRIIIFEQEQSILLFTILGCQFFQLLNSFSTLLFDNNKISSAMIGYQLSKPEISKSYFFLLIRISKCYLYFYILQILVSLALLIALLLNRQTLAIILQITACLLLACDLQLRCVSEGIASFFKSRLNIVDLSVFLIILSMVAVDFFAPQLIHHPEQDISLAFLILRYTVQLWRVVQLSRQSKKQFEINTLEEINLNSIHQQDHDNSLHA